MFIYLHKFVGVVLRAVVLADQLSNERLSESFSFIGSNQSRKLLDGYFSGCMSILRAKPYYCVETIGVNPGGVLGGSRPPDFGMRGSWGESQRAVRVVDGS